MLYRKYRPTTFSQVEGQEHIVQTLQGALTSDRVGHAYFFSGPRGTGKTTMARLFAKTINCTARKGTEPCNACFSCTEINAGKSLDLIEIDAASNTGVDNIRGVIESAGTSASSSKYKIFLVDEVHMLSKSAFNALLKTLEEPPKNTLFILATTEPHKVPETILSRVQRLDFRKPTADQIVTKLQTIAKSEKLSIDNESLTMIATMASGSFRDAESALAKVMAFAGTTIKEAQTSAILGVIPSRVHAGLLSAIVKKDTNEGLRHIADLHESGVNLEHFAKQFIDHARGELIATLQNAPRSTVQDPRLLVSIVNRFIEARGALRHSPIPQLPLELAIIDLTHHA